MTRKEKYFSKGIICFFILLSVFFKMPESIFAGKTQFTSPEPPQVQLINNSFFRANDAVTSSLRGVTIGADRYLVEAHYDNAYIQIDNGPIIYQTSMPARRKNSVHSDPGLLWHLFSRDNASYTIARINGPGSYSWEQKAEDAEGKILSGGVLSLEVTPE